MTGTETDRLEIALFVWRSACRTRYELSDREYFQTVFRHESVVNKFANIEAGSTVDPFTGDLL